jgi:mannose-6-phosphate isomerase-like protein (cupin superfamily)
LHKVSEWQSPTPEEFRETILPRARPMVLRGVAAHWPLVVTAKRDPQGLPEILASSANATPIEILRADPAEEGRFHYSADGQSLNFIKGRGSLPAFLAALHEQAAVERPYAMVAQGLIADAHVAGFATNHSMPLVPTGTEPRLWIGNASKVATHHDPVDNIAVVVAGRRRFTLFPPDAEADLYMGPAHPTPAGTPVSMVHVTAPDLERFPRFASAVEAGEEAELSPGDAIFIPKDWFHHVEALERFNMLANYWWDASVGQAPRSATS